jgi:hypothetical protein
MKRSLIFGLIAVLSAGLLFVGCGDSSDSGATSTVINGRLVDVAVTSETLLLGALNNPAYQIIGVIGTGFTLSEDLLIPKGKTVVLYAPVTVSTDPFEVQGELIVDGSGKLTADAGNSEWVLVSDGHIVVSNGILEVDDVAAVYTSVPGSTIKNPAFNTGGIRIENGTLSITDAVDNLGNIETLFKLVPRGDLVLKGVTEAIHPSVLATTIKTTATRRLTITDEVGHIGAGDPVEALTIPVGMSFSTADPLSQVTTLNVAGVFTASAATFTRLTSLTVSGTLSADYANYGDVISLVVDSVFNAGTKPFPKLETLTVNAGGNFVTTGNIGATAADFAGTTIVVAANGAASVGNILKLNTSPISGSLSATGFTVNTNATLTAADGGTINGVTFPAATLAITSLGGTTVNPTITIDDYTVLRDTTLDIANNSTLIIPAGKKLTIALYGLTDGEGKIRAQGTTVGGTIVIDGVVDYITDGDGVAGEDLRLAFSKIAEDTVTLTNNSIALADGTFGTTGAFGIGSVAIAAASTPTTVKDDDDAGDAGTEITLDTAAGFTGTITVTGTGTGAGDITPATSFSLSVDESTGNLKLADALWVTTTEKVAVLKFSGVKLTNSGLIAPVVVPDFSIGVKTKR